jgi:hypothetical protein
LCVFFRRCEEKTRQKTRKFGCHILCVDQNWPSTTTTTKKKKKKMLKDKNRILWKKKDFFLFFLECATHTVCCKATVGKAEEQKGYKSNSLLHE